MPTQAIDSTIFRDFYSTPAMRAVFEDRHLVQCWLDVEAALARAQTRLGIIPAAAAEEIGRQAVASAIDLAQLRAGTNLVGYPILPLVRQLAALCGKEAGGYVHWGATTQDIMDTGNVLQLRQALAILDDNLSRLLSVLTQQAQRYRETPMAGRTHGQQALPITLGFKLAVWVDELRRHAERLRQMSPRLLRCQFSGAVGTLASLGKDGWEVHQALAHELDLAPSPITWHTARDGFGEFAAFCGLLTATLGKMAREVATLQQTEYGEVTEPFEPGKGSSSTMPQKQNPILCETVSGISRLVAQQVPAMLAAMMPEHERAMGEWHIEWEMLPRICQLTDAALHHSYTVFAGLVVNEDAMRRNLARTNGAIVAEAVMMHLAKKTGRQEAHDRVYAACLQVAEDGGSLREALLGDADLAAVLSESEVDSLLDPANYIGLAPQFVDHIVGAATEEQISDTRRSHQHAD